MSRTGYEFRIVELPIHDALESLEERLNRRGKDGWQIVAIHQGEPRVILVFMQRPLYEAPLQMGEA